MEKVRESDCKKHDCKEKTCDSIEEYRIASEESTTRKSRATRGEKILWIKCANKM